MGTHGLDDSAANTGYGAPVATQTASISRTTQIQGYARSFSTQGQQEIAARGATVDLSDSVNSTSLQTLGTIRANANQRETDISQLEAASHSADPAQHTEMATLQRINQALLIELRTQQETNQMMQAQALQTMVGQKVQQDNLKSLFQTAQRLPADLQHCDAAANHSWNAMGVSLLNEGDGNGLPHPDQERLRQSDGNGSAFC